MVLSMVTRKLVAYAPLPQTGDLTTTVMLVAVEGRLIRPVSLEFAAVSSTALPPLAAVSFTILAPEGGSFMFSASIEAIGGEELAKLPTMIEVPMTAKMMMKAIGERYLLKNCLEMFMWF